MCFGCPHAWAQVTTPSEYNKTIAYHSEIGALTDGFAGESIDLSSGRLEIVQTDVDLPGTNALPVRVGRRFEAADAYAGGHFGHWSLDIPSVHGTFFGGQVGFGWLNEFGDASRCSSYSAPPIITLQGGTWFPDEYWHGTFFYLPGSGDQELLQPIGSVRFPSDGHSYHAITKAGSVARCVPIDPSSVPGNQGEGFEMVTPDGVIYTLNHMTWRNQSPLSRSTAVGLPSFAPTYTLPRNDYFLYPTRITDRFGNYVDYIWSSSQPSQLLQIKASDGRKLIFTYMSDGSSRIASVSDGTRTWHYSYNIPEDSDKIDTLTLPDGTRWTYRLASLAYMVAQPAGVDCLGMNGDTQRTEYDAGSAVSARTGSITSPSGAVVTFTMSPIMLGRSHLPYNCLGANPLQGSPSDHYLFMSAAVVAKTITGPGLPANGLHWSYSYGPTNNCWDGTYSQGIACTANSPTTRSVIVTDPRGEQTRYTFGNRANVDEGMLYRTEQGWNGSTALNTTEIAYAAPDAKPYGPYNGWSPRGNGDYAITSMVRPQRKVTTTRQGRSFIWEVASDCSDMPYCFDIFARPTKVSKASTP